MPDGLNRLCRIWVASRAVLRDAATHGFSSQIHLVADPHQPVPVSYPWWLLPSRPDRRRMGHASRHSIAAAPPLAAGILDNGLSGSASAKAVKGATKLLQARGGGGGLGKRESYFAATSFCIDPHHHHHRSLPLNLAYKPRREAVAWGGVVGVRSGVVVGRGGKNGFGPVASPVLSPVVSPVASPIVSPVGGRRWTWRGRGREDDPVPYVPGIRTEGREEWMDGWREGLGGREGAWRREHGS